LNEAAVSRIAQELKNEEIESVAICLLHSYANSAHEIQIRDLLRRQLGPEIYLTCSHEILPEIREYERTSTTVVNAYLGPVVVGYLKSLLGKLRAIGMAGGVHIMHSNGGVMTAAAVMEKPAAIIESGPAAGVIAGAHVASASGYPDIITIDMGGTTAKAAMIEGGQPARTTEYEVGAGINLSSKLVKGGGHAVKLPFIDVSEIGAGGGSKIRIDKGGLIQVGPESAGAVPGPVCYDAGGETPTLTDAVLTLGYLNQRHLAGGELSINAAKARRAIETVVAKPTGVDALDAAYGVFSIAAATMTRAVKAVSTYQGRDPRDFVLFAFGGNGPVIAHAIATLMDMKTVIVPPSPGVFSALGLLYSSTQHEHMQTFFARLDSVRPGDLAEQLAKLATRVRLAMSAEGVAAADIDVKYALDLRYAEQAYELTVAVSAPVGSQLRIGDIAEAFHREHQRTYGHCSRTDAVELVNLRASGTLRSQSDRKYDAKRANRGSGVRNEIEPAVRTAYFGKQAGLIETPVVPRSALSSAPTPGPLIIEEYDSTCVVPPGASVAMDSNENIEIRIGA
jgi:N-methylhydantoinase A